MSNETHRHQTIAGLTQLAAVLRARRWADGERHGLTPTQIEIVSVLCHRGPLRISVLARQLMVSQPTMSEAVTALEAKGLVERGADPRDGRATVATVTEAGRALAPSVEAAAELEAAVGQLDETDCGALRRSLTLIVQHLQERGVIEPQRHCLSCRFFRPYAYADAAKPHRCEFVNAAFGDANLRLDCGEHETANADLAARNSGHFSDRGGEQQSAPVAVTTEALILPTSPVQKGSRSP